MVKFKMFVGKDVQKMFEKWLINEASIEEVISLTQSGTNGKTTLSIFYKESNPA